MAHPDFVGRTGQVTQILGEVGGPGRTGVFFNIEGIPGIGKTWLLDHLADLKQPGDVVVLIDGGDDALQPRGGRLRTAAPDDAAELTQFRTLLWMAFKDLLEDGRIADLANYLTVYSQSTQPVQPADFPHYLDELLDLATAAANALDKDLAATSARFLVLVDNFHLLAGRPLGQWVMTWLTGIKGADVVVTHEDFGDTGNPGLPRHAVRASLGNLSRKDVEAYLNGHPDIGPDAAAIIEPVWDFTGGYPLALGLVGDLIRGSGSRDEALRLIRQLTALEGGRAARLENLVNGILGMIDDDKLRQTLNRVCITRRFDRLLVEQLMHVDPAEALTLIKRLSDYSFVRESIDGFSAVSDFVRGVGERDLSPGETQATHSFAEDYFYRRIGEEVEPDETSYESWYWYEKPGFQALERDWLYHLSRLTGSNRRRGRIGIARIFLDAFWWWGNYVPFPFCQQILDDWADATSDDDEDDNWHDNLQTLYEKYPKGWRKADTPAEHWTEVQTALLYLWSWGGFGQAQLFDRQMRHIRGLLDFFLADAVRYANPDDREADERLEDARDQFKENGDDWNTAWAEFHLADLAVSRGRANDAIDRAIRSAESHPDPDLDDHEVLANLHRVCADAQWLLRDPGAALDAHARAVLHAYSFQVTKFQDDYTKEFQKEMIDRGIERLAALHADGQDKGHAVLRSACARIRAFFGPYWQAVGVGPLADVGLDVVRALDEGRRDDVAGLLFPAPPTDLGNSDTPYAKTCRRVAHQMRGELDEPPCTALPRAAT